MGFMGLFYCNENRAVRGGRESHDLTAGQKLKEKTSFSSIYFKI